MTTISRIKPDVLALSILVLAVSQFHARGLVPGQTFLPVDLANNNLPWRAGPPQPLQNWLISDLLYEIIGGPSLLCHSERSGSGVRDPQDCTEL